MTHERPQAGAVMGARGHLCCLFMNEYMCALRVECCRMWVLVWALHTWGHLVCCQEAVGVHASDSTDGANLPWSRGHGRTGRKRTEENFRVQSQRGLSEGTLPHIWRSQGRASSPEVRLTCWKSSQRGGQRSGRRRM